MSTNHRPLRLISYNILEGGMGRIDPIYETLLYLDADIIGLAEADDPEGVEQLARKLGYEHVMAESVNSTHHVALLSRIPIQRMVNLSVRCDALSKSALEAVVEVDGLELRVVMLHLQHGIGRDQENQRLRELEQVLNALDENPDLPTVLMGDLNANAPYHPVEMAAARPKLRRELADQDGAVPYEVVARLRDAGWVDAYHRLHPEAHSPTFTTGHPAQRLDYIWLDGSLAGSLVEAHVETEGFAPYCSDHYPIRIGLRRPLDNVL